MFQFVLYFPNLEMEEFESELKNCEWADNSAKDWKLIEVQSRLDDDSEILVPSSHPDSDAELEQEPVIVPFVKVAAGL